MSNELEGPNQEQEMGNTQKNNMFINLVSGRPASVAKALRFGLNFLKAGWDVALLLNIDGVQVINPVMEIGLCPVTGQPLPEMLKDFRALRETLGTARPEERVALALGEREKASTGFCAS